MDEPRIGDYVLATKYSDGDPCDHFFVGFVSGRTSHGRWHVVGGDGCLARGNGFRRVEKITPSEGRALVGLMPVIGDVPGRSVWDVLDDIRSAEPTDATP